MILYSTYSEAVPYWSLGHIDIAVFLFFIIIILFFINLVHWVLSTLFSYNRIQPYGSIFHIIDLFYQKSLLMIDKW